MAASEALLAARRHPSGCRKAGRVRGRIGVEEEGERENQPGMVAAGPSGASVLQNFLPKSMA